MAGKHDVDATTRRAVAPARAAQREPVPALTVLLHPDPDRIGEVALLEPSSRLSRLEPDFSPPRGGDRRPLGDPNLSRRPLRLAPADAGGVRMGPAEGGSSVLVGDRPLREERLLSRAEVERGVTIELADRVALLLHRRPPPRPAEGQHGLVGDSEALEEVRRRIERVADLDVPVLIRGETGTGKELVARAIHAASPRASGPLVAVNAGAIREGTAGSILFGHERGAFTGADRAHRGHFLEADGGTLFLDEVGEIPPDVQAMLLRAIEERHIRALGADKPRPVDARLIAATDADLERASDEGSFKSPLLHRLAGYQISLPPLRARPDDIGRLAALFLREELRSAGEPDRLSVEPDEPLWISASLMAGLVRYRWPGNVRELRNVCRHLVISSRGEEVARPDELVAGILSRGGENAPAAGPARAGEIGEGELVAALRAHRWRPGKTAAALGISKSTLYGLMERCPSIRKARDLSADEIRRAHERAGGDFEAMAETLEVSERGLKLRVRELGVELG